MANPSRIQGFTAETSVAPSGIVHFKVDSNNSAFVVNIYRLGFYGGIGAREVASVTGSALSQQTPNLTDNINGTVVSVVDASNWQVDASWQVPSNAISGIYLAKFVRNDGAGSSFAQFVVRNDVNSSAIVLQTADTTQQAYNGWGGWRVQNAYGYASPPNGFYGTAPNVPIYTQRGYEVSYNRPVGDSLDILDDSPTSRDNQFRTVQWLEQNGYDVSYVTGRDVAQFNSGANPVNLLTNGHWSLLRQGTMSIGLLSSKAHILVPETPV